MTRSVFSAKPGLLDINVLIALIDPAHQFHAAAHAWFKSHRKRGWATCPITENGCLRIMRNPGYPFPGLTVERVRGILTELVPLEGASSGPTSSVFWQSTGSGRNASTSPKPGRSIPPNLYLLSYRFQAGRSSSACSRLITMAQRSALEVVPDEIG